MNTRSLTESEIAALISQGCSADDWSAVYVSEPFYPGRIQSVQFTGTNTLGKFTSDVVLTGDLLLPSGIYRSHLHNCTIGDEAYIANVHTLANYEIGRSAVLENIGTLAVDGETSFGNGTPLNIVNEAGGRTLLIYDRLSAQIAFLQVFYPHRPHLIGRMEAMIHRYAKSRSSNRGHIGQAARIRNAAEIVNVAIGDYAEVTGVTHLERGTIKSCREAPTRLGPGVIARDFIILEGTEISDNVLLNSCFVGQSVSMGKQYSAEHSAFFANSEAFHGEAVSLFAGPYTVTHHKSTLLIAGLYSFFNAGSGTNQSNHMYKLGPVHQGIIARGCKTGSFAYLAWPARVGPFTAILGKHSTNFDTSDLPFSYITGEDGRSLLTPAMNLFTVGTLRDSKKWPNRDKRRAPDKLDLITFPLFNPYTMGKVLKGIGILQNLYADATREQEYVKYQGVVIKRLMLKMAIKYYEMAVRIYLGDVLINRLEPLIDTQMTFKELREKLLPDFDDVKSEWIDLAGLILPESTLQSLIDSIEDGDIEDIAAVQAGLRTIDTNFTPDEWRWCIRLLEERTGKEFAEISREELMQVVNDWQESTLKLHHMILNDALKEYDISAQIGYGINSSEAVKQADFQAVRGTPEENGFIRELKETGQQVENQSQKVITGLENLE